MSLLEKLRTKIQKPTPVIEPIEQDEKDIPVSPGPIVAPEKPKPGKISKRPPDAELPVQPKPKHEKM